MRSCGEIFVFIIVKQSLNTLRATKNHLIL